MTSHTINIVFELFAGGLIGLYGLSFMKQVCVSK